MRVDMKSFLASGAFGHINLPVSRQIVVDRLGEPDDWTAEQPRSKASIWKYGNVEFHFEPQADMAWMIFADDLTPPASHSTLDVDEWIIHEQLRLEDAETALRQEGIVYRLITSPVLETIDLITASNVKLSFARLKSQDNQYFLTSWSQQNQQ